jgi:hypothetical protein
VRRALITLAALVVSGGLLWLALAIGAVGYETRTAGLTEGRLRGLLEKKPRADLVTQAFENEGTSLLGSARGAEELRRLARLAGSDATRIQAAGEGFAEVRAFRAGGLLYFVFFDAEGVMAGYAWAKAR